MAIANNGPHGSHRGRIGNIVYYMLNGQPVSREIGVTDKPPTVRQLTVQLSTKICSEFLASVKEFTQVGFAAEAEGTTANPFNLAVKYNRKYIIKGTYPDLAIDFEKVVLSAGNLKQPENWQVTEIEEGLQYTWDADPQMPWVESTDQVMMLAYFPLKNKVVYTLFGNNRLSGGDILEIPPSLRDTPMETYMSFVAADRKQTAHSIYTGSFNQ